MGRGKEIAQGAHASMKATLLNLEHPSVQAWLNNGSFTKIAVGVSSEEELHSLVLRAQEAGIITALIVDSGRTVFKGVPTVTCCAIGPATQEELFPITGHLPLL